MGIRNLSFPACWFSGGKGAEPNSTRLRSSNLKSLRVLPVQANASNLLLIHPNAYLRRRSSSSTSLIVPSLISTICFYSFENLSLGAGAGAEGFVAPAFGPDPFGGKLLGAIEY